MKQLIILLISITISSLGNAQQIRFEKYYDFGYSEAGYCVKQTPDSGYVVAGFQGIGIFSSKFLVVKTDKYGTLEWSNLVGDGSNDRYANYITNTADGGYAAVGYLTGIGFVRDIYVVRLNNIGDTLWTKHYGTQTEEIGSCIQETADHNFIISFYSGNISTNDSSGILKIDSVGNVLWWKKYSLLNGVGFRNIFQLPDNGYILSGGAQVIGFDSQGIIIRTDSLGDSLWLKQFGGIGGEDFYEAQPTLDGNIIVGGISSANVSSLYDSYVLKLDLNGDTIWTKRFGTTRDGCLSITTCSDGGYAVAGTLYYSSSNDMFMTKINSNGDSLWTKTYGGTAGEDGYSIRQTFDGGFIISGSTESLDITNGVYLVKTDSLGFTNVGINELTNIPIVFTAYPNPTKDFIYLKIEDKEAYTITITDEMGRILYDNKFLKNTSTGENKIDFSGYDNGIYFLKISSVKCSATKKIIKID